VITLEEIYHKYKKINGVNTLVIYVDYPDEYEFSLDFNSFKKNVRKVSDKIREYAMKNIGTVSNQTALLVLNGVVIGTLFLTKLSTPKTVETLSNNDNQLIENIEIEDSNIIENTYEKKIENLEESTQTIETNTVESVDNSSNVKRINKTETKSIVQKNENNNVNTNSNNVQQSTQTTNITPTNEEQSEPQTNNSTTNTNTEQEQIQETPQINEKTINLKLKSGNVIVIPLEEYIVGVVGSEMPAAFSIEALKAQAVAARTYALKKDASGKTLSATVSDQTYKTVDELKTLWGGSFNTYYNKVKSAVEATKGEYMTYNGSYIDALYFSTSNGKTEDPIYVWGNSYPYLKSVDSSVDKNVSSYKYTKTMNLSDFCSKLGVTVSSNNDINILSRTTGNRVNEIIIGGKTFTGVNVRTTLQLRSADFTIDISGSTVTIITYGYGHGCGMSQYGANELAKQGYSYSQILHHYYTNIQIQK